MVGYNGVNAAWLLLQHMGNDIAFQARWLPAIHRLATAGDLSLADYALLADRVRLGQGKPQLHGSQFRIEDGKLIAFPIEDEAHLDQRRARMGLEPEADYRCVSSVMAGIASR